MNAVRVASSASPLPRQGLWQRRVIAPIRAQLTQGVAPDQVAATLGVGAACALFPFLGATSLLNLIVGVSLRLNQPILQALNLLLGPVQLALILVYVRVGEVVWGSTGQQFTIGEMIRAFGEQSFREFLRQFGWAGIHGLTAWAISAPIIVALVYFAFRPVLRRFAGRMAT
jgi:uncharacterized protein (DUF2062 family)